MNRSEFKFTNKVALVTGGSTGIGRATSLLFARHGASVVIGDLNPEGAEVVDLIEGEGGNALFVKTDVSNARQVEELVARAGDIVRRIALSLLTTRGCCQLELCCRTLMKRVSIKRLPLI
jgi:NAD(P)-dependent dehydrogenase (short-subunit alcohol dehydrogenase family)